MQRIIYISLLLLIATGCRSELERKFYNEIPGLWQYRFPKDSTFDYQGCIEFFSDGNWIRHDGCTIASGQYWFDEDSLFTTEWNYRTDKNDTIKAIIFTLESGKMTTFDLTLTDTIFYQRTDNANGESCWSFEM
ncbi:hypothetical protein K6119_09815 [Paracrocinitomix mangrovi]|uniref:hypothetical protein n=1 Tax=Paracrocinitomix mangrovi TaxID=2862509 RepID=UPI001C8D34E8|nr:hypothetical protein [Paracrocinitomix mangrovi]UKN03786.1 hypothetical protein K6119_09815 [Paracrocinitomix mangrovi]